MDLSSLYGMINDVMVARYTIVSAVCLVVYEYGISFNDEKRLIWPSRLSPVKILFLLNRYLPFVTVMMGLNYVVLSTDGSGCKRGFYATGMFSATQYIISEAILFTRCYALWGRNRVISVLLLSIFVPGTVAAYYVTHVFLDGISVSPIQVLPEGCLLVFSNRTDWVSLVILIFCETVSISLLLIKAAVEFRHVRSPLLQTMRTDGVFYYVTVLLTTIANLCVLLLARPTLCNFMLLSQGVIHSVLCSRLLLRLRGAYESLCEDTCESTSQMLSSGNHRL